MSTTYQTFAQVYDSFMDNIPYNDWANYLTKLLKQYNISKGTLIELACGTGTLCKLMANMNYDITGIDISTDMLNIAKDKCKNNSRITLHKQNMCELSLENTCYDGAYCLCDGMNYLLYDEEIIAALECVRKHLKSGGVFIFDLKTIHFYQNVLGDQVFCDHQDNCSYTWENSFFEDDCINQYDLTLFIKENKGSLYKKFEETHHQRGYKLSEMIDFIQEAGLEYVTAYDAFTTNVPHEESERIYIIARNGE